MAETAAPASAAPVAAGLLRKPLVVVTGKGGVGKSTVAAALGLAAARRGLRTIIAEVARRDDVSRVLGGTGVHEDELAPGLHHISIDPEEAMEEYLVDQLPTRALADVLLSSRGFSYFAAATPGLRELLTVGKVWELAQEDRRTPGAAPYDLVILDAPATGHGVAVLSAPRTFADAALMGRIARQGRIIDAMLSDPAQTGVVAVARPEEMPVNETLALETALPEAVGVRSTSSSPTGCCRTASTPPTCGRSRPPRRRGRCARRSSRTPAPARSGPSSRGCAAGRRRRS